MKSPPHTFWRAACCAVLAAVLTVSAFAAKPKYDALGRLVGVDNADGAGYEYTYDDNGNRTNRIPYTSSDITILLSHPAAGTVTGAGRFRTNTTTTLTATAAGGFDFVAWKRADGTVLSTEQTYVHTVTISTSITAEFRPGIHTIQPGPSDSHDIWTTSVYSYTGAGGGPGGGMDNDILRVGGWGDQYYSLLKFNLDGAPTSAANASVHLYCFLQPNPTAMYLDQITSPWEWKTSGTGADRLRLWWADRPTAIPYGTTPLPAPIVGQWYTIDVTRLYNEWKLGTTPNHGIQLRPVSYFSNNFNTFYSGDTLAEPSLRPKLVVTASEFGDADSDGLPNLFEIQAGLNPNNPSDARDDADSDGQTNLNEYVAGTNLHNALDVFAIHKIERFGAEVKITFPTKPGRFYESYYSLDLIQWGPTDNGLSGTGNLEYLQFHAPAQQVFFKILVSKLEL